MPYADERAVRLYYDSSCGSCRLLARAAEGVSHHRVDAVPLDAPVADRELRDLSSQDRFGSAHLVSSTTRHSGSDLASPLVSATLGPAVGRVVAGTPPLERSLRWLYNRFWNYRRTRGCAAATFR
jgi:hypothetical protein